MLVSQHHTSSAQHEWHHMTGGESPFACFPIESTSGLSVFKLMNFAQDWVTCFCLIALHKLLPSTHGDAPQLCVVPCNSNGLCIQSATWQHWWGASPEKLRLTQESPRCSLFYTLGMLKDHRLHIGTGAYHYYTCICISQVFEDREK